MRAMALATAVALFLAGPALADGPIATAPAGGAAAPQPTMPSPPLPSPGAAAAQSEPIAMGPCGPEKVKPDGSLETAPHGELEAGVGTNGYRHVAGAVCQPIGQDAAVAASVSETQGGGNYRRR
jgi:hypothetical protein